MRLLHGTSSEPVGRPDEIRDVSTRRILGARSVNVKRVTPCETTRRLGAALGGRATSKEERPMGSRPGRRCRRGQAWGADVREAIGAAIEGLELAARSARERRPDRGPAGPGSFRPPGDDRVGLRGCGRDRHAALEPSDGGASTRSGGPARRSPTSPSPCTWRTASGCSPRTRTRRPLRRHLQRAHAPGDRQDPRHDRGRRARGAPPGHLARHRRLSPARLLRERRLAGDLGRRGRGVLINQAPTTWISCSGSRGCPSA